MATQTITISVFTQIGTRSGGFRSACATAPAADRAFGAGVHRLPAYTSGISNYATLAVSATQAVWTWRRAAPCSVPHKCDPDAQAVAGAPPECRGSLLLAERPAVFAVAEAAAAINVIAAQAFLERKDNLSRFINLC